MFAAVSDPIRTGLVESLARPGGNVTGLANQLSDAASKKLELLREVVLGHTHRRGVVGLLSGTDREASRLDAIWRGLNEAGYVEV